MHREFRTAFAPDWSGIQRTVEACRSFLREQAVSYEIQSLDLIVMIVQELAENAVKYGHSSVEDATLPEARLILDTEIVIEVSNRSTDSSDNLRLHNAIQWIREHENPRQAHAVKLRNAARNHATSPRESGLGLTRIACEGGALLDIVYRKNHIVTVQAVLRNTKTSPMQS